MQIEELSVTGVKVITPKVFGDQRGFFLESFNKRLYDEAGIQGEFVQDNHSKSAKGVIRGLHFQKEYPQGKLVRVTAGEVWDVILDIRKGSPSFGQWVGVHISAENKKQVWVPAGLAHGFAVLSEIAEFMYKVTDYYHPEDEKGVLWDDPSLKIDWKVKDAVLSEKDRLLPRFQDAMDDFPEF